MPLLDEIEFDDELCDLVINVEYQEKIECRVGIDIKKYGYDIFLGQNAIYKIDIIENIITCISKDYEHFFSTLFNIPFSVYFLSKGLAVFHACSMVYENQILCLAGNKGVGKTTLMSLLMDDDYLPFSDDTVLIDNDHVCYRAHKLSKVTSETIKSMDLKVLKEKNLSGKHYMRFESKEEKYEVSCVIQLVRSKEQVVKIQKIENELIKKYIFKSNIVGVSYFNYDLINKTLDLNKHKDLIYFKLFLPDNLDFLKSNKENIKELIKSTILGEFKND